MENSLKEIYFIETTFVLICACWFQVCERGKRPFGVVHPFFCLVVLIHTTFILKFIQVKLSYVSCEEPAACLLKNRHYAMTRRCPIRTRAPWQYLIYFFFQARADQHTLGAYPYLKNKPIEVMLQTPKWSFQMSVGIRRRPLHMHVLMFFSLVGLVGRYRASQRPQPCLRLTEPNQLDAHHLNLTKQPKKENYLKALHLNLKNAKKNGKPRSVVELDQTLVEKGLGGIGVPKLPKHICNTWWKKVNKDVYAPI